MNARERDLALDELIEAQNLVRNAMDIFKNEYAHWDDRQNFDARMHQIKGIDRHLGYLIEYVKNSKIGDRK